MEVVGFQMPYASTNAEHKHVPSSPKVKQRDVTKSEIDKLELTPKVSCSTEWPSEMANDENVLTSFLAVSTRNSLPCVASSDITHRRDGPLVVDRSDNIYDNLCVFFHSKLSQKYAEIKFMTAIGLRRIASATLPVCADAENCPLIGSNEIIKEADDNHYFELESNVIENMEKSGAVVSIPCSTSNPIFETKPERMTEVVGSASDSSVVLVIVEGECTNKLTTMMEETNEVSVSSMTLTFESNSDVVNQDNRMGTDRASSEAALCSASYVSVVSDSVIYKRSHNCDGNGAPIRKRVTRTRNHLGWKYSSDQRTVSPKRRKLNADGNYTEKNIREESGKENLEFFSDVSDTITWASNMDEQENVPMGSNSNVIDTNTPPPTTQSSIIGDDQRSVDKSDSIFKNLLARYQSEFPQEDSKIKFLEELGLCTLASIASTAYMAAERPQTRSKVNRRHSTPPPALVGPLGTRRRSPRDAKKSGAVPGWTYNESKYLAGYDSEDEDERRSPLKLGHNSSAKQPRNSKPGTKRLNKFKKPQNPIQTHVPPPPTQEFLKTTLPDETDYVIEKILDKSVDPAWVEWYLIKWDGYSSAWNTWEPRKNISEVSLKEFEDDRAQAKKHRKENIKSKNGSVSQATAMPGLEVNSVGGDVIDTSAAMVAGNKDDKNIESTTNGKPAAKDSELSNLEVKPTDVHNFSDTSFDTYATSALESTESSKLEIETDEANSYCALESEINVIETLDKSQAMCIPCLTSNSQLDKKREGMTDTAVMASFLILEENTTSRAIPNTTVEEETNEVAELDLTQPKLSESNLIKQDDQLGTEYHDEVVGDNGNGAKTEHNFPAEPDISVNSSEADMSPDQLETIVSDIHATTKVSDNQIEVCVSDNQADVSVSDNPSEITVLDNKAESDVTVKQLEKSSEQMDETDECSFNSGGSSDTTMSSISKASDSLDYDGSRRSDRSPVQKRLARSSTSAEKSATIRNQRNPKRRKSKKSNVAKAIERRNIRKGWNGTYIVESILDTRVEADGTKSYWTKWKGYSSKSNTWEPKESFSEDLLAQYEEKMANKSNSEGKRKKIQQKSSEIAGPSRTRTNTVTGKSTRRRAPVHLDTRAESAGRDEPLVVQPALVGNGRLPMFQHITDEEGYQILHTETNLIGRRIRTIVGMTHYRREGLFIVGFEGDDSECYSLVKADHMNLVFPHEVISFYENKIVWDV